MSEFLDALRQDLICPKCHAMNRPGAYVIELDVRGVANCGVCGHGWTVRP